MTTRVAKKGKGTDRRTGAASNGHAGSLNGGWRDRVQPPRITDPEERRAAIKRATSRIKTDVRVNFTRERRGR